jgi:hypothetical protein
MIRSATPATAPSEAAPRKRPPVLSLVILVLLAIVVIATGVGVVSSSTGPAHYACMSISRSGSDVSVTTSGLIHYVKAQYYISCNEGSPLPTSKYRNDCLTISPQTIPASIGLGASTEYYYFSANGSPITLQGAPTPTNTTEITVPAGISISIAC